MDFSKFLDDDFDAKDWVNAAFRTQDAKTNKENFASTLALKLQLFIQEVHKSLEETGQQAVQHIPRVLRDVENAKREATFLNEQMQLVKEDIKKIEEDTAHSMETLVKVDTIKSRMQAASQALQEADKWSTLSEDIEKVFESGEMTVIAEKLIGMQRSLYSLVDIGDYAWRSEHLANLKVRYEALVTTDIVTAFMNNNYDEATKFSRIFHDIESDTVLEKYYHNCLKNKLLSEWKRRGEESLSDGDTEDNEESEYVDKEEESLVKRMTRFYDIIQCTFHQQVSWCGPDMFHGQGGAAHLILLVVADTLGTLMPSMASDMSSALDGNPDILPLLIQLRQSTDAFAKSMESAIVKCSPSLLYDESSRRLALALYQPYKVYVSRYASLERDLLFRQYERFAPRCSSSGEPWSSSGRVIADSIPSLYKCIGESLSRCHSITGGVAYGPLLDTLQLLFERYVKDFASILQTLKSTTGSSSEEGKAGAVAADWDHFLHSLRIIHYTGDVLQRAEGVEKSVMQSLLSVGTHLMSLAHNPPTSAAAAEPAGTRVHFSPLTQWDLLLLGGEEGNQDRDDFYQLVYDIQNTSSGCTVMSDVKQMLVTRLCEEAHALAFHLVMTRISQLLRSLPNLTSSTAADDSLHTSVSANELPSYSFAPNEYITKIGQYLMTLPQHLDTFTSEATAAGVITAINHGCKLAHSEDIESSPGVGATQQPGEHTARVWLVSVSRAMMYDYVHVILSIPTPLSNSARRQLVTDIHYITDIVEDIDVTVVDTLRLVHDLLSCDDAQYNDTVAKVDQLRTSTNTKIVRTIAKLRNITSDKPANKDGQ